MLVKKEVIRPGTYWYRDQQTGAPRKLTVTPELTRYWAEQGNAMLATGLTVPVPIEHDFDAHPMTPADKLLNNSGWVKEYGLDGDRLYANLDVQDEEIAKKLPTTIKWTSPWINSFTDGNGREWKNVISHLALTTRPRIVEQEPFGSVAAALSMAEPVRGWDEVGSKGLCLSHAGLLVDDAPAYPMAFSLMVSGEPLPAGGIPLAWSPQARKAAAEARKRNAAARRGAKVATGQADPHDHSSIAHTHSSGLQHSGEVSSVHHLNVSQASRSSAAAHAHSKAGRHDHASVEHHATAIHHVNAAKHLHASGDHEGAYKHAEAANAHFQAAKHHMDAHQKGGSKKQRKSRKKVGGDDDVIRLAMDDDRRDDTDDADYDDDSDLNDDMDDLGGTKDVPAPETPGDVTMEELLCDLLGALGVHLEHSGDPAQFKRELYNAVMTEIHNLAGKGKQSDADPNKPNRTNPPGMPPNNPKPGAGKPAQPNPLIQQETQPMYMSLEQINELPDPLKGIALAMYNENVRLREEVEESRRVSNSLRDAKLAEAKDKRDKRIDLLGKLSPKVKADLEAMRQLPAMALSMGDGGAIVDPMASTLAVLEKGLSDIPRLLTTDTSSLVMQQQPTDADMLSEDRANEYADVLSRAMGCMPDAKAS